ncbi:TatD family hydrolase [Aerococcaceae bacterium zg-ZJ1578]|uniref:TatD family hydrolase n=1 Tax=Aerococcaceae bacterium zg-252 TaxID=2796928 RepID=UPI001A249C6A|nr:TatD family hydrolase [Aerococcaceae bacterium zg-1578]
MTKFIDTHFHFDFIKDELARHQLIQACDEAKIKVIAQTVLPTQYPLLKAMYPIDVALGLHPWYIENEQQVAQELQSFLKELPTTHFIGEIGLDFAPNRLQQVEQKLQVDTFSRIIQMIRDYEQVHQHSFVVSIHTVRSASVVLDILEKFQLYQSKSQVIFHYFNGTSDELMRHVRHGGWLSIHPNMLHTKKGRAYIKQVPINRLLLETDLPKPEQDTNEIVTQYQQVINQLLEQLTELLGVDVRPIFLENQAQLYRYLR